MTAPMWGKLAALAAAGLAAWILLALAATLLTVLLGRALRAVVRWVSARRRAADADPGELSMPVLLDLRRPARGRHR